MFPLLRAVGAPRCANWCRRHRGSKDLELLDLNRAYRRHQAGHFIGSGDLGTSPFLGSSRSRQLGLTARQRTAFPAHKIGTARKSLALCRGPTRKWGCRPAGAASRGKPAAPGCGVQARKDRPATRSARFRQRIVCNRRRVLKLQGDRPTAASRLKAAAAVVGRGFRVGPLSDVGKDMRASFRNSEIV